MPFRRIAFFLTGLLMTVAAAAQTTFIPGGGYSYPALNRLEIKNGTLSPTYSSGVKPYSRRAVAGFSRWVDSLDAATAMTSSSYWSGLGLTETDRYQLGKLEADNAEWLPEGGEVAPSQTPFLKVFYRDKANFFAVRNPDFFMAVNPLLRLQAGKSSRDDKMDYIATRGVEVRGRIAGKVGFYGMITENQERGPDFFRNRVKRWDAVPGIGYYKRLKDGGVDYLDAAGYITFGVSRYIDVQFGYDKNVFGDGYRSVFLSDYGPSYLFLKLNTHVWKLNYTNIFAEVISTFDKDDGDFLRPKKYMASHRLGVDVTPWLNLGVFESVIFTRKDHFEFQYLNPIIFYRTIEQAVGSPDNANLGFDARAIVAHHFEFYTQFLLDELKTKEFFGSRGWWGNKWALQLGAKYVDAFGVPNLDVQGELNVIRPYTYTHGDSVANYSHYNQPLAHPQGANLVEAAGIIRYHPLPRLSFLARAILSQQGMDDSTSDWGGNIFLNYQLREKDYGNKIRQGYRQNLANISLTATYELKHNFFVDLSYLHRKAWGAYADMTPQYPHETAGFFSAGLRWNMGRRDYNY